MDNYNCYLDVESIFQDHNVYVNGMTNKPSHPESYMTIIDFTNLNNGLKDERVNSILLNGYKEYVVQFPHHVGVPNRIIVELLTRC